MGRYWSRLSLIDPPTHLLVSFAHVLIHSAPPTPLPISFTHARSALRLEPLVSPSRARRSAGCVWCTTHAGRSDCTPPNDACVVPMHPPATACVAGGPSTLSVSIFTGADDGTRVSVPPGTKARSRIDAQQVGVQVWSVGAPMCPGDESGTVAPPPYFAKRPLTCSMLCHHIMSLKPLSSPFVRFGPQATRGCARHEGGDPFAPCPTTRGRFQRAHPRGRAWYRGGAGLCFVG